MDVFKYKDDIWSIILFIPNITIMYLITKDVNKFKLRWGTLKPYYCPNTTDYPPDQLQQNIKICLTKSTKRDKRTNT